MRTVVPIGVTEPKSRLADALRPAERAAFAGAMLRDVLDAVREAGGEPVVLADAPLDGAAANATDSSSPATVTADLDAPVIVDDRPLTAAVEAAAGDALRDRAAAAVVMADLALATPAAVKRLYDAGSEAAIAIAPGRGGGTNALVVRDPAFAFDYHGASVSDHRAAARAINVDPAEVDSFRLATDVDEPADLAEVLLHAEGRAAAWLRDAGFELAVADGRVGVERS